VKPPAALWRRIVAWWSPLPKSGRFGRVLYDLAGVAAAMRRSELPDEFTEQLKRSGQPA
jgi:hypothetical protein